MKASLSTIVLFVADVALLRNFYVQHFELPVIEEIPDSWVLLGDDALQLGLHRMDEAYQMPEAATVHYHSNVKLVFDVNEPLEQIEQQLLAARVVLRPIQQWAGYAYRVLDGEDPEGNVFQLRQRVTATA